MKAKSNEVSHNKELKEMRNIKETIKSIIKEESEYETFFRKALDKAGKGIADMDDAEKKAFFNKIDAAWTSKGEKNEGNAFGAAVVAAKKAGEDEFEVGGKTFKVESVNEEKYTVIDAKGNQMGASDKMQATSIAKKKGGENAGFFVVSNKNALKARRALEKFKGDFKNPKLRDMMADLFYEEVKIEGNTFGANRAKAIAKGDDSFKVDGKSFKVTGVDAEDKENAEKFTNESGPGLWANIRAKQARGEAPASKGSKAHKDAVAAGKRITAAESVGELPKATVPASVKAKLDLAIDKIKDTKLSYNQKLSVVGSVMDSLGIDKSEFGKMASKLKGTMEGVNENFSTDDIAKIKGAVEGSTSFMGIGAELKKLGMKYSFSTEPLPLYMIMKGSKKYVLINKKYAESPDFVIGNTAGGMLESKSVNENFSIKRGYNTFTDYEKNAKVGDTILKYDKRGGMIKTFVKGSELHKDAQRYLSKVHSIAGGKVNLSLFGKQGHASVPDYEKNEVGVLVLETKITEQLVPVDKKAVDAFFDKKDFEGKNLNSDGMILKTVGVGSQEMFAHTPNGVKMVGKVTGRYAQSLVQYVMKNHKSDLVETIKEVKVGQMIKVVNNPHWEAAFGKKGPFKRKVKMIDGDNVFFTDGSNSSMKYVTEATENVNEGNAFGMAVSKAKKEGLKEFEFNGKTYQVKKGSYEKNEAAKKLAEKENGTVVENTHVVVSMASNGFGTLMSGAVDMKEAEKLKKGTTVPRGEDLQVITVVDAKKMKGKLLGGKALK